MDSSNALALVENESPSEPAASVDEPAAILRGTARGLEMVVNARASVAAICDALATRLEEAPGFFKGSNVRIAVDGGPLAMGCLGRLDELAQQFDLTIVEVSPLRRERDAVPTPTNLAAGSAPATFEEEAPTQTALATMIAAQAFAPTEVTLSTEPVTLTDIEVTDVEPDALVDGAEAISFEDPTNSAAPLQLAATPEAELETNEATRLVVGPVRSGVILEHRGHLFIFGDVNPGAEIRATGNIIVLGRLRGTAHAGIEQEVGFILALRLEPQQLRIGRTVARAADSDAPASDAEIAYSTGSGIVVERYLGKLPRNLATSI